MKFKLVSPFQPTGDQPEAIKKLTSGLKSGLKRQVLLGVTGSGKTFTMAKVIENFQRPTLVISHNKTLAAQLYQEFKEFFPENEVHYFVSYYDYYQPEAYIPQTDTYIAKDAKINEEIDQLRHAATQALLVRNDIIIVASVSCIYNIGSPAEYENLSLELKEGQSIKRRNLLEHLTALQYQRQDIGFQRGTFRVRGEVVEVWLATGEKIIRLEMAGDKIERITQTQEFYLPRATISLKSIKIFPAKYWVTPEEKLQIALQNIKLELQEQLKKLKNQKKLLEAERLRRRTLFDLEMLEESGYCHGVENYSRHLEFRQPGQPPYTLLDYYLYPARPVREKLSNGVKCSLSNGARDFLTIIDESHMTIPQIGSMYEGDRARKETLIAHGFRLPSALDNRPFKFKEFEQKIGKTIYVSATPAPYELNKIKKDEALVEQIVRPTGLVDPAIVVRLTRNQVPDLISEIEKRAKKGQRVLVTTLTKRLAEDLAEFLRDKGIKAYHLHSEIKTLERPEILRDLRLGKYDVVVGINLLREGLDLPEVSLVAILDADKEGFLRSATTLVQTMGRAARHIEGRVIMYADKITGAMRRAIKETERRRKIQGAYNKQHKIIPRSIKKGIKETYLPRTRTNSVRGLPTVKKEEKKILASPVQQQVVYGASSEYLEQYIKDLQFKADLANRNLQFDKAVEIKKEIEKLKLLIKRKKSI